MSVVHGIPSPNISFEHDLVSMFATHFKTSSNNILRGYNSAKILGAETSDYEAALADEKFPIFH